ncbi:MAG: glycerol kinase GlpK [Verrucomicrobiota bacterium]
MSDRVILAMDQGTTSSRGIVFDEKGQMLGVSQEEFTQHYPESGWVEHDAQEIWDTQLRTALGALVDAGRDASTVAAIGITNQRETAVLWDRETGGPVCRAIVWQDRRTAEFCDALKSEGKEALVSEKTGLRLDPYFSGTKVRWMLDHVDGVRERAEAGELAFGTIDSWLVWNLTGGARHVTDASNASRTLLYNIHEGDWDEELLGILDVPRALLPEVVDSSGVCGEGVGALAGVPVAGIAGDQQAALFGQGCFSPGQAKNTYGTGCFLMRNTGSEAVVSRNNLLTTVGWRRGGETTYALEGSVFIGGAVVQWLRDELKIIEDAPAVNELAATVEDSGGVYLVPAFAGLGAPYWNPHARGALFGITRGTTSGHLARAALESIGHQVTDLLECMAKDAGAAATELHVDGGASRSDFLLQFQADLSRLIVRRPKTVETTALGAAYLAGLGVGYWKDEGEITENWELDAAFGPERPEVDVKKLREGWARAVAGCIGFAGG